MNVRYRTLPEPGWRVRGAQPPSDFGPLHRQMAENYYDIRRKAGANEELIDPRGNVVKSAAEIQERNERIMDAVRGAS